jgi:CRP/FNR family transcriptional regulator, cyclic AMP receptor protein
MTDTASDEEKIIALLARMPMLKMFDKEQLRSVLAYARIRRYDLGDSIIEEGGTDKTLFFLITGNAYVVKNGVQIGEFSRTGDIFGEMSIIDGSVRSASIVSGGKTLCLSIASTFFENAGTTEQTVMCQNILFRAISELLAERLRAMNQENITLRREVESLKSGRGGR